ncbi:3-oxoacid CoA-transferase subunit B [[Clostridium] fimetarium]|uniref:Acetate CoA/acetoacetate CoA-transferase beta subunit n=1 Tax=[Clostridium] fimetarium TaxID=99656 RepID=A0A1I0RT82_9FIRM|nr:3-oxoacid CoA-transferase subunit B [[Clostridium] fimetarium]SEW44503.1 acetate CoA/acetoacetate CoA-transferase beta subunit [[Clostridium] fimetarium]
MGMGKKELMAKRAAMEVPSYSVINLGIGIPTMVANYLPEEKYVMIQGENGLLGIGKAPNAGMEDPNIINAGGIPCTLVKGGSFFDSGTSFGMIRKGHIDISFLGALEVDQDANLANWIVPGKIVPGMGGGMELAQNAKKVIILSMQTDKKGESKIRKNCTLPITAKNCVDMIITDMAVFQFENQKLVLKEIFADTTVQEVIDKTEAEIIVDKQIKIIPIELSENEVI